MGCIGFHMSSNRFDKPREYTEFSPSLPNPNPFNFQIVKSHEDGNFLIVKVRYPDCTNYEGMKILVYENITLKKLSKLKALDPHFAGDKGVLSPIARFEPSPRGWIMAQIMVNAIQKL